MNKTTLIIIGAGITGLYSAWKLAGKFNIIVLEAGNRFGGRIHSISSNWGIIEAGAEFVHGNAERTLELLKTAGIKTIPVSGKFLQSKQGRWVEEADPHADHWEKMLDKLATAGAAETLTSFLDKNFGADSLADFRKSVNAYAEGFDVADPGKASAKALYNEWSQEGDADHRIDGGYVALTNFLLYELNGKVDLQMNSIAAQLDLTGNNITVTLSSGKKITAGKVLLTIPVSLLAAQDNAFSIRLPAELNIYREAAKNIGFGGVIKIILECYQKFWKEDVGFIISDEIIPTWWTQFPLEKPVLTGWVGGTKALKISDAPGEQIKDYALQSLSSIFGLPIAEIGSKIQHIHIFNWFNDPLTKGAYSYAYPQSAEAKKLLRKNFNERIWFAGEALYDGPHPGTVEAALVNAEETIQSIITAI